MRHLRTGLTLCVLLTAACRAQDTAPAAATSAASPAASLPAAARPSAGQPMPPPPSADTFMQGCPTTVPGARTTITGIPGGVEITVVGDGAPEAEIRRRGQHLLEMQRQAENPGGEGDAGKKQREIAAAAASAGGKKQGTPGLSGRCAIMFRDATLVVSEVPGGARFTLKTTAAEDGAWLVEQTRDRHDKAERERVRLGYLSAPAASR